MLGSNRVPTIREFSRGGVHVVREGFGIILRQGDREVVLASFEVRELAVALLLLTEEADRRLQLTRLGWTDEAIDKAFEDQQKAEEEYRRASRP